ncbi:MAG TPA: M20/M25/M40 family metallo-hydrolase [Solirubrobacteraceae bacterium]|nr:M20/M25/M40 family metallo-hydrolase [Solirubrobacteraceae bacterium]
MTGSAAPAAPAAAARLQQLGADIGALAGMVRGSASPGEKEAAVWAQARLYEAGLEHVALEPYRWPRTWVWAHLAHVLAGLSRRRAVRVAAAISYELECSGRLPWLSRWVAPQGHGLNVAGLIPARGKVERTFVLLAHLDAQRSGWMWDPRLGKPSAKRRAQSPAGALSAFAILTGARPLIALTAAALADTALRPTVPGANDNASGVAAVLACAQRLAADPLPHTEVLVALVGAEESGMGGMRAFLRDHPLDPQRSFVLSLDTVGSGTPVVARAEGTVLPHAYRDEDLRVVERGARAAGLEPPERWRIGAWTDPILARQAGIPAVSMLSVGPGGAYTNYHRMTDVPERVDLDCVARCAAIAESTARTFAAAAA